MGFQVGDVIEVTTTGSWEGSIWEITGFYSERFDCRLLKEHLGCEIGTIGQILDGHFRLHEDNRRLEIMVIYEDGTDVANMHKAFEIHDTHLINSYEGFRGKRQYIYRANPRRQGVREMLTKLKEIKTFMWSWV